MVDGSAGSGSLVDGVAGFIKEVGGVVPGRRRGGYLRVDGLVSR